MDVRHFVSGNASDPWREMGGFRLISQKAILNERKN